MLINLFNLYITSLKLALLQINSLCSAFWQLLEKIRSEGGLINFLNSIMEKEKKLERLADELYLDHIYHIELDKKTNDMYLEYKDNQELLQYFEIKNQQLKSALEKAIAQIKSLKQNDVTSATIFEHDWFDTSH